MEKEGKEKEQRMYPFAIVGLFITDKDPLEVQTSKPDLEAVHKLEEEMSKVLFDGKATVLILPLAVPPEEAQHAIDTFVKTLMESNEGEE